MTLPMAEWLSPSSAEIWCTMGAMAKMVSEKLK